MSLFANSLSCEYVSREIGAGIHVVRFDPRDVYAGYPALEAWFASGAWDVAFRGVHLSDSLRLALLHRFGGVYLDTDLTRSIFG